MTCIRPTALAAVGAAVLAACGGDGGGTTEPPGPPAQVTKTAGDGQTWYFSNPLPDPYRVTVKDANNRNVPNVTVTWAVASGGGSVSSATSQTNASGVASARHSLGPTAPSQSVTASVAGLPPLGFSATATAPPTAVDVSVRDNSFQAADTAVQVNGTVTWTWTGAQGHNVIFAATSPTPRPPNSGTQTTGTHSGTFTVVGRYDYFCNIHSGMNGTVHVVN